MKKHRRLINVSEPNFIIYAFYTT